jgi:transposase-like protein
MADRFRRGPAADSAIAERLPPGHTYPGSRSQMVKAAATAAAVRPTAAAATAIAMRIGSLRDPILESWVPAARATAIAPKPARSHLAASRLSFVAALNRERSASGSVSALNLVRSSPTPLAALFTAGFAPALEPVVVGGISSSFSLANPPFRAGRSRADADSNRPRLGRVLAPKGLGVRAGSIRSGSALSLMQPHRTAKFSGEGF